MALLNKSLVHELRSVSTCYFWVLMKDIQTTKDIELLIDRFYKKVMINPVIGHFFTEVVHLSWEHHIPIMISFWSTMLLGTNSYQGNPMIKHMDIDKLSRLEKHHFDQWLVLWEETINENFAGDKAHEAISRAKSIAAVMQLKVEQNRTTGKP
jgi:hemoglobin